MAVILIAGGTGLVGRRLSQLLQGNGHEVRLLSRRANAQSQFPTFTWNLATAEIQDGALDQVDYVINLAGAGIADGRWTAARKKLIIDSRVQSAAVLQKNITGHPTIKAYLGASAIGYYGDRSDDWMDEQAKAGTGFLPESTLAWEAATAAVQTTGLRTITLRIGIVLSTLGGALPKMLLPFKMGMANYLGNGKQYYSWIHIDDLCGIIQHLLLQADQSGTYNAVAPTPKSNYDFTKTIKKVKYPRALLLPAPAFGIRLALGEMADVVLISTRVTSKKIENAGFEFQHPALEAALVHLFEEKV